MVYILRKGDWRKELKQHLYTTDKRECQLYTVESDQQWAKVLQKKYKDLVILPYIHYYPDMQEEMSSYLGLTRNIIEIISNNILSDKIRDYVARHEQISRKKSDGDVQACSEEKEFSV